MKTKTIKRIVAFALAIMFTIPNNIYTNADTFEYFTTESISENKISLDSETMKSAVTTEDVQALNNSNEHTVMSYEESMKYGPALYGNFYYASNTYSLLTDDGHFYISNYFI